MALLDPHFSSGHLEVSPLISSLHLHANILDRGELAASALEANLNTLESKLDELLASIGDADARFSGESKEPKPDQNCDPGSNAGKEEAKKEA